MNMETTKLDMRGASSVAGKQPLSSTKSIDEGFESDPDREQSTDSEQNSLLPINGTASHATISNSNNNNTFDVVQLTDRDGMHHTQITRRMQTNGSASTNAMGQPHHHHANHHMHMMDADARANGPAKINPKVTIPRAGGANNHPVRTATPLSNASAHGMQYNTYRRSPTKGRSALSLIGGHDIKTPRSLSAEAVRIRTGVLPTNTSQRYLKPGSNGSGSGSSSGQHYGASQYSAFSPVMHNSSSLYTFYPAEGNISLYPSQYGLRYKSSHLNVEEQAPITMWSQSIPRHSKRWVCPAIIYI